MYAAFSALLVSLFTKSGDLRPSVSLKYKNDNQGHRDKRDNAADSVAFLFG
jgi:hypothetical protein